MSKRTQRTRRVFSDEYKGEAVALVATPRLPGPPALPQRTFLACRSPIPR